MADRKFLFFHRKRNKKLLVQTGLLIGVVFVALVIFLGMAIGYGSRQIYLNAKNEMIDRDLLRIRNNLANIPTLNDYVDYWEKHPQEVSVPLNEAELDEFSYFTDNEEIHTSDFSSFTEEEKKRYARYMYIVTDVTLSNEQYSYDYDALFFLDVAGRKPGYILVEGDPEYDSVTIGNKLPVDITKSSIFKKIRSGNYKDTLYQVMKSPTGEAYYIGIAPVKCDGGAKTAVVIVYNWSEFEQTMKETVIEFEGEILILMAVTALLLLFFLFLRAVRPVTRIQKSVRGYMQDKDSMEFVNNMSRVQSKNEFGVLADDLSLMASELQDFSQKNIGLAELNTKNATELELAAKMQMDMLPKTFPDHKRITVAASMTPAKHVGGDLYDVFEVDEDHVAFLIADVAGKGVPAALLGSSVQTIVKYYTIPGVKPSEILFHLNNEVCAKELDSMFVTVWIGILNIRTGHFMTSNAGHEYPVLNTGKGYELFKDVHGMPAGSIEDLVYQDQEFWLKKDDRIFVYTDGAAEATNVKEEMFETKGILKVLNEEPEREPQDVLDVMKERIDEFVGEAERFDDLTMLSIRYNGTIE